ncbi:hypothetical protein QYE76_066427 [Lolium multiflorum]|uniref:CCHC-type domain-containing protein n=1 Tax=Lolium multiflorum TaxID=4521 RepID=A0AAD8SAL5_LOLMU|nr:hypothetical protein QYE76_066427 [Lolium multiflorum]
MFMIREGESVADAYGRLGALRVKVKGLGCEKYNDGFEMNEHFINSKVIAMIAVKQKDTNLALNLQLITKSADLNADDLVSYVAANENMAKIGERLMAMNRVDEASHNLALKARADHEREEVYEIEEDEEMTSTSDIATDFAFFAKKYKAKFPMLLNEKKKKKRTCYNCDEDGHFANECPYEKRVDKPKAFVGAEYTSDDEEEDEEKEAGVAGLAFSKPGSLFTYDYSKDYSTENDVGSSFMVRTTQDDDSNDSPSSTIVGSCLMARETKVMESPPSLSSVLDDETENQEELAMLKELYKVRCTLRGEALVKFDFLMDSLKEKDESIEELEYHLNDKERRFNLLRQELKTERCISQGLKQQIETFEVDKAKDLETIERAQSLTQELDASNKELEVAHASLTRDLDHLERANKLAKDGLKKLGESHDLLQETYKKALGSMNDPIVDKNIASSSTSFTSEHAKLVEEHVRLQEELSLHVETNTYLESLVTKYGLNYHPNESACEQATILEENVRLKKELAKFTTTKNKMGLDDLLSKQRSNNQKHGLGYVPKPYKKNNYKKEKPAQEKNKKVTNNGKASKGKATSGDRTGPNNHYALFIDYYGDVYANYVGPRNGYAYRGYSIWGYSFGGPKWVFDSGCTNHMTGGRGVLDQFIEDINKNSSITFGENSKGKDETHREFIIFAKKDQHMYESEIKAIRTDNDTKFKNYTIYYNKSTGAIEVSCDVVFLEDNGSQVEQVVPCVADTSSDDGRGAPAKRGRPVRPPGCRTSSRTTSKAAQGSVPESSTGGRSKSVAKRKKDKRAAEDDDLIERVPTFNAGTVHVGAWRRLREKNPYRFEERTYTHGDRFFWTNTQQHLWDDYYNSPDCMKNGTIVMPRAINKEALTMHQFTRNHFVIDTLQRMGLF